MSEVKKLDHIGILDSTNNDKIHFIIAQYSNNTIDFYCNKQHVNTIYNGKIKVPQYDNKDDEYQKNIKKSQSSSLEKFHEKTVNSFEIDEECVYLIYNPLLDPNFTGKPNEARVDIYKFELKLRTRIGRDLFCEETYLDQKMLKGWYNAILEDKVREFYKPCTSCTDLAGNIVFSHRNLISLYSTLASKWSHIHISEDSIGRGFGYMKDSS